MSILEYLASSLVGKRLVLYDHSITESNHVPGIWKPDVRIYPLIEEIKLKTSSELPDTLELHCLMDDEAVNPLNLKSKDLKFTQEINPSDFNAYQLKD